ncbi:TetR family transcriptional regulator [Tsukamurella pseudospumae]|uniref:TetR family transcriptional regulator n=1 Tax=Tsukamurella pseudospumae TaxID=239498 RepID=A0A138AXT7_9ACTN|nr:TetR family transcriptional regulator [Tsukamurella pseudospumae]KXP15264.1 TetR family transcriptional regulator [Tsukamurella pseudospumae]
MLLIAGLDLLGECGFTGWSMRRVEDAAGVPHGTARHHFSNQRGLIFAMVRHLLSVDQPAENETPHQQITRWLGVESGWTRARYELIVASFHDEELARELVGARDRLVSVLVSRGMARDDAACVAASLDGLVLDAVLRRSPAESVDAEALIAKWQPAQ